MPLQHTRWSTSKLIWKRLKSYNNNPEFQFRRKSNEVQRRSSIWMPEYLRMKFQVYMIQCQNSMISGADLQKPVPETVRWN
ncbi:MAG: DUF2550 family protein [Desulfobacterales bacterium]|nr:MAG: DUF2550 family protein [Desulfobacterales bacterium]